MEDHHVMYISIGISVLALVVSAAVGYLQFLLFFQDRGNVKISAWIEDKGKRMQDTFGQKHGGRILHLTVVNEGRRPVNLISAGLVYEKEQSDGYKEILLPWPDDKTIVLEESRLFARAVEMTDFRIADMKVLYVKDSTGKDWELSKKDFKKLLEQERGLDERLGVRG